MRLLPLIFFLASIFGTGCVVRHGYRHHPPPHKGTYHARPSEPPPATNVQPPPEEEPPAPPEDFNPPPSEPPHPHGHMHRAPPVDAAPAFTVRVVPDHARPGEEVKLYITPFPETLTIYFNGKTLPKRTYDRRSYIVPVPGTAPSGVFTVEAFGQRVQSNYLTIHR